MKICVIPEKMYGIPLRVVVGSYQEYSAANKKRYGEDEGEQKHYGGESYVVTFTSGVSLGKAEGVIWLPEFDPDQTSSIATLCHECTHIAFDVAEKVGIMPNSAGQEPLAYLQEYYFRESLRKLKRLKIQEEQVY